MFSRLYGLFTKPPLDNSEEEAGRQDEEETLTRHVTEKRPLVASLNGQLNGHLDARTTGGDDREPSQSQDGVQDTNNAALRSSLSTRMPGSISSNKSVDVVTGTSTVDARSGLEGLGALGHLRKPAILSSNDRFRASDLMNRPHPSSQTQALKTPLIQSGRISKRPIKRPLLSSMHSSRLKDHYRDQFNAYLSAPQPSSSLREEKTNWQQFARGVFTPSPIFLSKHNIPHRFEETSVTPLKSLKRREPPEVINLEDSSDEQSERDTRGSNARLLSLSRESSTFSPSPSRTPSLAEPLWLESLRKDIETALTLKGTPKFDELKRKDEERMKLVEKRMRPKSNNFPGLDVKAMQQVQAALRDPKFHREIAAASVGYRDLITLRPGTWLNDEIVNFYIGLILERSKKQDGKLPKVHCFTSFFYSTLVSGGYAKVRRWTKKIDIFSNDYIIIPVNINNAHWCCAAINFVEKRIEYYDSMHHYPGPVTFQRLRDYLNQESLDKRKKPFDFTGWEDYAPTDIPLQLNGSDCGVFVCTFAEFISRNEPFDFAQNNMPDIRRRMIYEISNNSLMDRAPPQRQSNGYAS